MACCPQSLAHVQHALHRVPVRRADLAVPLQSPHAPVLPPRHLVPPVGGFEHDAPSGARLETLGGRAPRLGAGGKADAAELRAGRAWWPPPHGRQRWSSSGRRAQHTCKNGAAAWRAGRAAAGRARVGWPGACGARPATDAGKAKSGAFPGEAMTCVAQFRDSPASCTCGKATDREAAASMLDDVYPLRHHLIRSNRVLSGHMSHSHGIRVAFVGDGSATQAVTPARSELTQSPSRADRRWQLALASPASSTGS